MAKTRAGSSRTVKARPGTPAATPEGTVQRQGGKLESFAEDLGRLLGTTERKATEWLNQRQTVVQQLTAIRDKAGDLLQQLGQLEGPFSRRTSRAPAGRTGTASEAPKRSTGKKRRTVSAETRARMAEAAKARWAKRKARSGTKA